MPRKWPRPRPACLVDPATPKDTHTKLVLGSALADFLRHFDRNGQLLLNVKPTGSFDDDTADEIYRVTITGPMPQIVLSVTGHWR